MAGSTQENTAYITSSGSALSHSQEQEGRGGLGRLGGENGLGALKVEKQEEELDDHPYQMAILDAMVAEPEEIRPLVKLTPDSPLASVRGNYVLLGSIHHFPRIYPEGQAVTLPVTAWTFTDKEFVCWLYNPEHLLPPQQEIWRLKQLLGLSPREHYTHITFYWVHLEDVIRPATCIDPNSQVEQVSLNQSVPDLYKEWYQSHIVEAYSEQLYPWTRLGYTYDWGKQGDAYGLTEFLIHKGAMVYVVETITLLDFLKHPYLPSDLPQANWVYEHIEVLAQVHKRKLKEGEALALQNQPLDSLASHLRQVETNQPLNLEALNVASQEQGCGTERTSNVLDLGPRNSLLD